jgi:hypothetical protein
MEIGNRIHSIPIKDGGEWNLIYAENRAKLIYAESRAKDSKASAEWKCNLCRKQG